MKPSINTLTNAERDFWEALRLPNLSELDPETCRYALKKGDDYTKEFQTAAHQGCLGQTVLAALDVNTKKSLEQRVLHGVLALPAWQWPVVQAAGTPFPNLVAAIAREGDEKALQRLRDEGFLRKLPLRAPAYIRDDFTGMRVWTSTELFLSNIANIKIKADPAKRNGQQLDAEAWAHVWNEQEAEKHIRIVRLLQDDRVRTERTKDEMRGSSAIGLAVQYHMNYLIPELLANGERLDVAGKFFGSRPVQSALDHRNFVGAQMLIDAGADINQPTGVHRSDEFSEKDWQPVETSHTTLQVVFLNVHDDYYAESDYPFFTKNTVPWAVARGAKLEMNAVTNEEYDVPNGASEVRSILCLDTLAMHPELTKAFIHAGADVNGRLQDSGHDSKSPLLHMLEQGRHYSLREPKIEESLLALMDAGARFDGKDSQGNSMLHLAAAYGAGPTVLQRIMDGGNPPNALNLLDETPLMLAAGGVGDFGETVDFLLQQIGEDDVANWRGELAWIAAFSSGTIKPKTVKLLMEAGIDVTARNVQGKSCLRLLSEYDPSESDPRDDEKRESNAKAAADVARMLLATGAGWHDMEEALEEVASDQRNEVHAIIEAAILEKRLEGRTMDKVPRPRM